MSFHPHRNDGMFTHAAIGRPHLVINRDHRAYPNSPNNNPETNSAHSSSLPASTRMDRYPYYGSQDYPPISRDTGGEQWPANGEPSVWYDRRYTSSPPPPQSTPSHYQTSNYTYIPPPSLPQPAPSSAYHNQSPTIVYRDDRRVWESPPDDRTFEPSAGWRHSREPSASRISNISSPAPHNLASDERRWRTGPENLHIRDYADQYPPNYHSYDYPPLYYDSRVSYTAPGPQYYDEPLPQSRPSANYRPPPPRTNRPSALGNYKRHRQPSQGQYRQSDNSFEHRRASSPPSHILEHNRSISAYSQPAARPDRITNPLQATAADGSDSESTGEESEGKSSRASSPARSFRHNEVNAPSIKPPSLRRFSPVRHDSSSHHAVPRNIRDSSTPSTLLMNSPPAPPPETSAGRQSVMSVHNLIAPTPAKVPTPLSVVQKSLAAPSPSKVDLQPNLPVLNAQSAAPQVPPVPSGVSHATTDDEGSQHIIDANELKKGIAPVPALSAVPIRQASTSPDIVSEPGHDLLLNRPVSDFNAENGLASLDEAPLKQYKEPQEPMPEGKPAEEVTPSVAATVVPTVVKRQPSWIDRPKPDEKMIFDTLRKAIMARRNFSTQTREQRVNPVLMANLAIADPVPSKKRFSPGIVVKEVMEKLFAPGVEEQQANVRAALATSFAAQNELLAEKTQKLRDEYLTLHKRWLKHCLKLDAMFKASDMHEIASVSSRTTRRSAATLGDAVRSDLEMEQIIATLGNEDLTDPNHLAVRNVATVPDMISVEKGRLECLFDDTNGLVDDPASFYDPRSGFHDWTPEEEAIFYDKYAEYPKQFGIIASALPNKTAAQCVLYYYIHKKKLVDFRQAANSGLNKRKGTRKGRKRKGNALLADIEQTDSQRPAGRGRRRGGGRGRGGGIQPVEIESDRPKRRRTAAIAAGPKIVMAKEMEMEDSASVTIEQDTDQPRDASTAPKKPGRKGRKSKNATDSPAEASPAPGEPKFIDANETLGRRRVTTASSHWSEADIDDFLQLLTRHGKDFKRISASLPSKTVAQVSNYYKNHKKELGLEKIAQAAQTRSSSADTESRDAGNSHQFVEVTRAEASQSQTPTEESQVDLASKDKAPAPERTWSGEEYTFPSHPQAMRMHQPAHNQQSYILQPGVFHAPNAGNRGMILHAHSPIPFAVPMVMAAGRPAPIGSPVPHLPSVRPSSGQAEADPQAVQGQQGAVDARYSSFRTHLPPGSVFINDKRMPIPIQPAPGHGLALRPDGYSYFPMHPGAAAIHYGPIPSPDQAAHARITSANMQQQRMLPVDTSRPLQSSTSGRDPNNADVPHPPSGPCHVKQHTK